MIKQFFKLVVNSPKNTLFILFCFTIVWAFFITKLKIDFSIEHLFSQSDLSVKKYFFFRDTFGREDNVITIIYKPNDPLEKRLFPELEELVFEIEELSGVKNALSIFTVSDIDQEAWLGNFYDPGFLWNKDTILKKLQYIQSDPSIGNRILSDNLEYGAIIITVNDSANNHKTRNYLIEKIKLLTDKTSPEWIYSGVSVLRTEYVKYMLKDNFIFLPPIAILLISILRFIFQNWVHVFLPIFTVIISVIWLLGIMGLTGLEINIMTYIVPTLLFIIGIGDAIHIQARFKENLLKSASDPKKAMVITMTQMSKVIFLTSITTAIGFLALVTTPIKIVQEFGVEIALGVIIAWLISILIVPAGILTFGAFNFEKNNTFSPILFWLSKTIPKYPWSFILIPLFITISMTYKIKDISTDASLMDDLRPKNKLYQDLKLTEKHFGGVLPFEILLVLEKNKIKQTVYDPEIIELSKNVESLLRSELKHSSFFSISTFLESIKRINKMDDRMISDPLFIEQIMNNQQGQQIKLVNANKDILRITGLIEDKTSSEMENIYTKLDSLANTFPPYLTLNYTGTTVVALNTNKHIVKSLVNSLGIALIFISLIMAFLFRANSILFASLLTNIIPIFTVLGILAWLNISIRPPTAMTFSVALGIAVDDSLHFLLRYRRELANGLSRLEAIKSTIMHTGSALLITTSVLVAGFSVLLFSAFLPTYQFGLLSAAMISTALICDLTLLPALCLILPNPNKN